MGWFAALPLAGKIGLSLGGALGIPLLSDILGLNDPSGAEKRALATQDELARAQRDAIYKLLGIGDELAEGARGFRSVLPDILAATGGQGFMLPREAGGESNAADILRVLAERGSFDEQGFRQRLLEAAGVMSGLGTGGILQGGAQAQQNQLLRDQDFKSMAADIAAMFLRPRERTSTVSTPNLPNLLVEGSDQLRPWWDVL